MTLVGETNAIPLQELVNGADLVLVCQLGKATSYLTADALSIMTDYEVIPRQVLVDRVSTAAGARPGQVSPLTLTLYGGEVVVNGVKVTLLDITRNKWRDGADLLLFLLHKADKPGFWLFGNSAGAFEIDGDGRVRSLRAQGEKEPEMEGVRLENVLQKIQSSQRL